MFPIYLIKIRYTFTTFKFFPITYLNITLLLELLQKKSDKKINCGRWSENADVTLPGSKEVRFEKILSINVDVLEILVGKNIRGSKKLELRVSMNYLLNLRFHILISQYYLQYCLQYCLQY